MRLREVNWLGDGTIEQALCAGWHEVFVKVRSTRPAQPAWLSRGAGGIEVDLIAGEDGVSPGQACVFYDAPEGQARVLGGGFIHSAFAATERSARATRALFRARVCLRPTARYACSRDGRRVGCHGAGWGRSRVGAVSVVRRGGGSMAGELDQNAIGKAYARWAPVYDLVFGQVFDQGRKASIAAAERIGGRILDVGIGTGISLIDYSPGNRIVGVDYCEPMLRQARQRVAERKLAHVEALAVMDAQHLGFPDASFDAVVAQFVITAVGDPEATLDEFARVTKPGGEIILVNHLSAEAGLALDLRPVDRAGRAPARLAHRIPLGAACALGRAPRRRAPARAPRAAAAGHFTLVRFERLSSPAAASAVHTGPAAGMNGGS